MKAEDFSKIQAGEVDAVSDFRRGNNSDSLESTSQTGSMQNSRGNIINVNDCFVDSELSTNVRFVMDNILNEVVLKTDCTDLNELYVDRSISREARNQCSRNSSESCQHPTSPTHNSCGKLDLESHCEEHALKEKVAQLSLCQTADDEIGLDEILANISLGLDDDDSHQLEIPLPNEGDVKTDSDEKQGTFSL